MLGLPVLPVRFPQFKWDPPIKISAPRNANPSPLPRVSATRDIPILPLQVPEPSLYRTTLSLHPFLSFFFLAKLRHLSINKINYKITQSIRSRTENTPPPLSPSRDLETSSASSHLLRTLEDPLMPKNLCSLSLLSIIYHEPFLSP